MSDAIDTSQDSSARALPLVIHAQYVRDASFENPHAPESLRAGQGQPEMDISIHMDARRVEDPELKDLYEVVLKLAATAKRNGKVAFIAEVEYGVTCSMTGIPEVHHHPMLLIEVPKLAFPFARQVMADLTQSGGFPPLLLSPVDFQALYLKEFGRKDAEAPVH